ncbi:MAG TPA: hypothetical protein DD620_01270 [Verrucomicrobia bacterium]|nr:hypothetical protein [Kiritimatiellaceae bacterium]MAS98402.1 hypothetical protein [Kiritimatiellaceae bacterium]HBO87368.1 hypothetical protein [Verrucomicrobiota bacterium]
MASINHFKQNHPVHLARRDAYFEAAVHALRKGAHPSSTVLEEGCYTETLFLLRVARLHARFSVRSPDVSEADEQFAHFVDLLTGSVKAILSMLDLRKMILKEQSFSFLGSNQATIGLQAEEYQRRAVELVRALLSTLALAEDSFESLKQKNTSSLDEGGRERYSRAQAHVAELMKREQHRYAIAPSLGRIQLD